MTFRPGLCTLLLAVAIACPPRLAAQRADQRADVLRFRDSIATISDSTPLLALESTILAVARRDRDEPFVKLRLGYAGLRLAELTRGAGHFRDAESEFQWVTELQPTWPMGWYALGRAELAEADAYPGGIRSIFAALGRDIFAAPARDIAHSAQVDSSFGFGLLELGNEALARGILSHLQTALFAFRLTAAAPVQRNRDVLLIRGMVERQVGDVDSAVKAFSEVLGRNPDDSRALLELGATQMAAGRRTGVAPWYRGVGVADSETARLYRDDLELVMPDSALRVYDAASGKSRETVVRRFWDSRDPDGLNSGADRLREHYRRMDYAHRNFALLSHNKRYDSVRVFAPTSSRFDDRGRVYVRHGEPDDKTTVSMSGLPPNETWVYHRPSGDLLFNFAQPDSAQGFRMYESILDIVGLGAAAQHTGQGDVAARLAAGHVLETHGAGWTAQAVQELLYSREKLSPVYARMLSANMADEKQAQVAERVEGRHSIAVGLQTDSWKLHFELPLVADIDIVAFGRTRTTTQMQVAFAIPGSSLYAPPTTGPVTYPIRMRVAVHAASGEVVASLDTTRNFTSPGPIAEDGRLLGRLPIDVPAGDYTVRVALETESRGLVLPARKVHVAPIVAQQISLSDIALGSRSVPLLLRGEAGDTAWFNPFHRFKSAEPIELAFDVGGINAGDPYRLQLAVLRPGHPDPVLQIAGDAVATGAPDRVRRELDIGRLGNGSYLLQVTVTAANGTTSVRQHEFRIEH